MTNPSSWGSKQSSPAVGVVGLGVMGSAIAQSLNETDASVTVFDVSQSAMQSAANQGLARADSVEQLAEQSRVVILSLPTPEAVSTVVQQLAACSAVPFVVDTSTIDPTTAQRCQQLLAEVGGDYADCPVLGRPGAVGRWTIPVGGTASAAATAVDVLAPVAARVLHVGAVGTASTLKILNNLMLGTINAVTAEVLVLAEAAGLDPGVFVDTLVDSGAASISGLFKDVAPRAVDGDFAPTFSLKLMHKDNALALALADKHKVPMPVGTATQVLNTMALSSGFGDEDSIAVVKLLERVTGQVARRHVNPKGAG